MGYQLIETIEVGSGGATSIEFTEIPQDGVDLVCVCSLRDSAAYPFGTSRISFNSDDTGSNYSFRELFGTGSSVGSSTSAYNVGPMYNSATSTTNTFSNNSIYISNYTSSSAKSFSTDSVVETNATAIPAKIRAQSWNGTAAITSLRIFDTTFVQYSTVSLYKVTAD